MERGSLYVIAVVLASVTACGGAGAKVPEYDLIIRGGRVIDGTGNPWIAADIGVQAGKITKVGQFADVRAAQVIDAAGKVVAPGFIDMHTHSDYPLLVDGRAQSKVRQGVTTEVLGEGETAGPIKGPALAAMKPSLARYGIEPTWATLGEYFARLEKQGVATNVVSYVAAGQVRACVIGFENRPPQAAELAEMRQLVAQAMAEGAWGLVTSLEGTRGFASTAEIIELAKVVKRYGGIYATHLRGESEELMEALNEAIEIGERAQVPVDVFHLKASGAKVWGRIPEALKAIEAARARGIDITANQYPYIAGAHPLLPLLPPWALDGGVEKTLKRLQDPQLRARMKKEIEEGAPGWRHNYVQQSGGWKGVMISDARSERNKTLAGKTLADFAVMRGKDPADAFFDLLLEEKGQVHGVLFIMNEKDVQTAMAAPWLSIGSDGSALDVDGPLGQGHPHPRHFGTFPRILGRYVRELGILSLEDAIRKMTSLAAQRLGLRDRGLLREGFWADIVVFDPRRVIDRATFEDPKQYSVGIEYVLVNGTLVVDRGGHTGALPGKVLRKPRRSEGTD
ncbi:MAG: D-aminoacylase [Acidobacteria bacterium]|nr:D-aminoacylase [Acidobacteriota bacterium]